MEQSIKRHYAKIIRVISSCITYEHILSAKRLVENFSNYWGSQGDEYRKHLDTYIFIKRNLILYEN